MISEDRQPVLKVLKKTCKEVSLSSRIRPSRGSIMRTVDPGTVPYTFGDTYQKDAWIPSDKDLVTLSKPFLFRDVRGVRLSISPVQYNPAQGKLRIYSDFHCRLEAGSPGGANVKKGPAEIAPAFEPLYNKVFANFKPMAKRLHRLEENGRLMIITPDAFAEAVTPLAIWKRKCGIVTHVVRLSEIGGTDAKAIKAFLQTEFTNSGFTHVILVGDAEQLPTNKGENEGADSDPCYVKLAGDDHVPDAIISRISATTPEEVAYQVAKFINYEAYPDQGAQAAWYLKAMGIASSEGSPTDFERMDALRTVLLKRYTGMDQIYDAKSVPTTGPETGSPGSPWYPPMGPGFPPFGPHPHLPPMMAMSTDRLTLKEQVAAGTNEGRGLINYIGHGSKTMWVTSRFGVEDCKKLNNAWRLPFIISVACVNGDFVRGSDCFCEAWLKAGTIEKPAGAVGIFGSSTNQSWVPPCVVQEEINVNFIMNETYKTAGGLMMNGIMKGLEVYGTEVSGEGVMMFEQWHWFGDCTTVVRTSLPKVVKIDFSIESIPGESQVLGTVVDEAGAPVSDVRVTCYNEDMTVSTTGTTTAEGKVRLNIGLEKGGKGYLTAFGAHIVPVIDQPVTF